MKYKEISEAVLYNEEEICLLNRKDLQTLSTKGLSTTEQRTRLCVHNEPENLVHEMFIIHTADTYVRPHRHKTKGESFHVLEGSASLILFDESGKVNRVIALGDVISNKTFYFKMPCGVWHMLIIHSKVLVFKEVTQGPFDANDCEFPDWAPKGKKCEEVPNYLEEINKQVKQLDAE